MTEFTKRIFTIAIVFSQYAFASAPKKQEFTEIPNCESVANVETDEIPAIEYLKGAGERSVEGMQIGGCASLEEYDPQSGDAILVEDFVRREQSEVGGSSVVFGRH